jgi:hypothetical protein
MKEKRNHECRNETKEEIWKKNKDRKKEMKY